LANKVRVLIVDDSALARKLLREGLTRDARIEVVDAARSPSAALELIEKLHPDVLTLDVELPEMDGVSFLRKIMNICPTPAVVVSSLAEQGKSIALDALEAGAFGVVTKPKVGVVDGLPALMNDLCDLIVEAARMDSGRCARLAAAHPAGKTRPEPRTTLPMMPNAFRETTERVIAIGSSAGGVSTLSQILPTFPAGSPGIVMVQHMPAGFTASFAERLNGLCAIEVKEAEDGDRIRPGLALLAPGGERHLEVRRFGGEYRILLTEGPKVSGHAPSVNVMFHSVAKSAGRNAAAAILTGMGDDGAEGMLAIRQAGGRTFAQDEETSVVFGMPGAAGEIGAAEKLVPLGDVRMELLRAFAG
jgi:two-component system, chemotaxis family, protein-glutamate methylesterase/glutaminase